MPKHLLWTYSSQHTENDSKWKILEVHASYNPYCHEH